MSNNKQLVGALDIGTSKTIVLIGEVQNDDEIHIIGFGQAPSHGLKAGMVTNIDATAQAITQAMEEAQLMADCQIGSVVTGIAGNHIRSMNSQGVVKIKEGEVMQADIDRAIETAKAVNIPPDHQILHTVVQEYIIDNQPGVREPIGMSGVRLDTRIHIVTGAVTAMQNIQKCIERCGLHIDNMILQPLASGRAVLTEDEKERGVCVIDIGGTISAVGKRPDGKRWNIGIRDPRVQQGQPIISVPVENLSISTSGSYERYFEQDSVRYHHIIDPATGYPVRSNMIAVSVFADSATDADALSTACFVLGYEKAVKLLAELPDTEALFIFDDNSVRTTGDLEKNIVILNSAFRFADTNKNVPVK